MIWFTSDLHLGHENVIKLNNRPFNSLENMNKTLINNYNLVITNSDKVFILGDLTMKLTLDEANEIISKLKGKKYLIKGNHDKSYDESLFEEIVDYKTGSFDSIFIAMMHYPMLEWTKSRQGSLHLHGHIHSNGEYNIENFYNDIKRYDVGVDANNYFPISLMQIREFWKL